MFNFTDTETSDPKHQRICQLAAILCDEQGQEVDVLNVLIKPDGWEVCERFVGIHGITTAMCHETGHPMPTVLEAYYRMLIKSKKLICHNYAFDSARLLAEAEIYGHIELYKLIKGMAFFCTMVNLTQVCCLPNANGRAGYKWPKLKEAHKHFFGVEFEDQHDALADNRACKRIYFEMHKPVIVAPVQASAPAVVKEDDFSAPPTL
jgi:DNA polymerase-3 subunit epsilon